MRKIGIIGAPASGKTTLSQNIASNLRFACGKKVELIDEYARYFVSRFGETTIFDQYLIAQKQLEKEKEFELSDFLITDCPIILSCVYAYRVIDWSKVKQRYYMTEIYNLLINSLQTYDLYFCPLLNNKKALVEDGKRIHVSLEERKDIEKKILMFLDLHDVEYFMLEGSLDHRVSQIVDRILSHGIS